MEKTRKWRKILAMMLTVVMMLQNAQSVMVFADVTNEQIEQRLAGNQGQTEETQPAQSQVDTRANGEEYKTQSQETQENGNGSTDIGSPESGNATTEAKTSNADVSATITQSVFQADVSGTTCNFVQMTAQITNNDTENPATGVSVKALLNSAQLSWVNRYGTETAGAGAYAVDSNNTADLPDGSANGYDQIVMWTNQTIGAGETVAYQFAAQIIPENLDGVVNAWYINGNSCSYTWENTEILVPTQAPVESTPEVAPPQTEPEEKPEVKPEETTPEVTEAPEVTPTPEVAEVPEATPTPEVTEVPEATPTPEVTEVPEATPTPEVTEVPKATPTPETTQAVDDDKQAKLDEQNKLLGQSKDRRKIQKAPASSTKKNIDTSENDEDSIISNAKNVGTNLVDYLDKTKPETGNFANQGFEMIISDGKGFDVQHPVADNGYFAFKIFLKESENNQFPVGTRLTYKLPAQVTGYAGEEGDIIGTIKGSNQSINFGHYSFENDDLVVEFNKSVNQAFDCEGSIYFWLKFNKSEIGTETEVPITFPGNVTIKVYVDHNTANVSAKKTASSYNPETGKFEFEVKVEADGSVENVQVKDTMQAGLIFDQNSIEVYKNSNATPENSGYTLNETSSSGFDMTLGSLQKDDVYYIRYTATLSQEVLKESNGVVSNLGNKVTITEPNKEAFTVDGDANYNHTWIKKSNQGVGNDNKITWNITVNPNADVKDIKGETIIDELQSEQLVYDRDTSIFVYKYVRDVSGNLVKTGDPKELKWTDVVVSEDGRSWSYSLNDDFFADQAAYEFVYKTLYTVEADGVEHTYVNASRIHGYSDSSDVKVPAQSEGTKTITKNYVVDKDALEKGYAKWQTTIIVPEAKNSVVYTDRLSGNHTLPDNIGLNNSGYDKVAIQGFTSDGEYPKFEKISSTEFKIDFGTINNPTTITITYYTKVSDEGGKISNTGIVKQDENSQTGWDKTTIEKGNINKSGQWNSTTKEITWTVSLGAGFNGAVSVEDYFSDNMYYVEGSAELYNGTTKLYPVSMNSEVSDKTGYKKIVANNLYIPVLAGSNYSLKYKTKLDKSISDDKIEGQICKNTVVVKDNHSVVIGSKEAPDIEIPSTVGSKAQINDPPTEKNDYTATFQLLLNEAGTRYGENNNSYKVTDTLGYNMQLKQDESGNLILHVYKKTSLGYVVVDNSKYTFTTGKVEDNGKTRPQFTIEIPEGNGDTYKVEYQVLIFRDSQDGDDIVNVEYKNSADFVIGTTEKHVDFKDDVDIKKDSSGGMTGSRRYIRIKKVASNDENTILNGAKFAVYKGNSATGTPVATKIITEENNYIGENPDVSKGPTQDEGDFQMEPGVYTIKEITAPSGYKLLEEPITFTVSKTNQSNCIKVGESLTVKNTKVKSITVYKDWNDNDNQDNLRDDETTITVQLKANNKPVGSAITLGKNNKVSINGEEKLWAYTWKDLPIYENSTPVNYTIEETAIITGEKNITIGDSKGYFYTSEVDTTLSNDQSTVYKLTNTHTPGVKSLSVKKQWIDNENQDGKRPQSINVKLTAKANESEITEIKDNAGNVVTTDVTLNADNQWFATWNNLPEYLNGKKITYKVTEESTVEGYNTQYSYDEKLEGYTVETDGTYGDKDTVYIKNIHESEKTSLQVSKVWNDKNSQFRPSEVSVILQKTVEKSSDVTDVETVKLGKNNGWTKTWSNLPVYENGKKISYSVKENSVNGYTSKIDRITGTAGKTTEWKYTITNTPGNNKINLVVNKTWNDDSNRDGLRDAVEEIVLSLQRSVKSGNDYSDFEEIKSYTVPTKDQTTTWEKIWKDLDKYAYGELIHYRVVETITYKDTAGSRRYTTKYNNQDDAYVTGENPTINISNIYTSETTDIFVTKIWNDDDNVAGFRNKINSIVLTPKKYVYNADKKDYVLSQEPAGDIQTVTGDEIIGDWTRQWNNLPKYENGKLIKYSVEETIRYKDSIEPKYSTSYSPANVTGDSSDKQIKITNKYVPEKISITVKKTWDDDSNKDGLRNKIQSITLQLQKKVGNTSWSDVGEAQAVDLDLTKNVQDNWCKWSKLNKYEYGELVQYRVKENIIYDGTQGERQYKTYYNNTSIDAFSVTGERSNDITIDIKNSYVPEEIFVKVKKEWNDDNDRDRLRKNIESIKFTLQVSVKGENDWKDLDTKTVYLPASNSNYNDETDYNIKDYEIERSWEHLSKYKNGGNLLEYKVVEQVNYKEGTTSESKYDKATYTDNISDKGGTIIVTNTHHPALVSVKVNKTWVDDNNRDNYRPKDLPVTLNKVVTNEANKLEPVTKFPDSDTKANVNLNANNKWSYEWAKLYKYEDGKEIKYQVTENMPDDVKDKYQADIKETSEGTVTTFAFTNTHETDKTQLTVVKNWIDEGENDKHRPKEINLELTADGNKIADIKLNAGNNWTWTSGDLDMYSAHTEENAGKDNRIVYKVKETTSFAEGTYEVSYQYTDGQDIIKPKEKAWTICTVTNKRETTTTKVLLYKYWYDNNNANRPEEATFQLTKQVWDGEKYGKPVDVEGTKKTIKGSSSIHLWQTSWEGLQKQENGKDIIYAVKELNVPAGYTAVITGENNIYTATNILSTIEFHKMDATGSQELEGAKMELYIYDDNNKRGSEPLVRWTSGKTPYVITSDKYPQLVPGTKCALVETAAPDGYTITKDVEFTINSDGKVQSVYMYDGATEFKVSKKTITGSSEEGLAGAKLQITKPDGTIVKVGDGEDFWISDGKTKTITNLAAGSYVLKELSAPVGYYRADDIVFEITENGEVKVKTTEGSETIDNKEITMIDYPVKVSISKKDVTGENELENAKLALYHVTDEIDSDTNQKKEELVEEWTSGKEPKVFENLIIDDEYVLKEVEAPSGYGYAADVRFTVKGDKDESVVNHVQSVAMYDGRHNIQIAKVVAGEEGVYTNIPGAKLQIKKGDEVIEEWVSETTPHVVIDKDNKIVAGETYTLHEASVPAGYVQAADIAFTVTKDGKVVYEGKADTIAGSLINMIDEPQTVTVLKTKEDGVTPLAGAKLQIVDSSKDKNDEGYVVETWTSGETAHTVEAKLSGDKTYYLEEVNAPAGYTIAERQKIDLDSTTKLISVVMKDAQTKVTISKKAITGTDSIGGAELRVIDKDGKVVVEKWTTKAGEDTTVTGVFNVGETYTLQEVTPPTGYAKAAGINFTLNKKGEIVINDKTETSVVMRDAKLQIKVSKKDITDTDELPGAVLQILDKADNSVIAEWKTTDKPVIITEKDCKKPLVAGNTYILHEKTAPDGYAYAKDVEFTVHVDSIEGNEQLVTMHDAKNVVVVSKTDLAGTKELPGAKLQILSSDGKTVLESWTSTNEEYKVTKKLKAGESYILRETEAPDGYAIADDVKFTVNKDGSTTKVVMKDAQTSVTVSKTDLTGEKEIAGAKLQILNKNGKVMEEWTSDGKTHAVTAALVADVTYILHEVSAPAGYRTAKDIEFTVDKTGKTTKVVMKDAPTKASILKTDESGKALSGAQLVVKDSTGKEIDKWTSDGKAHEITGLLTVGETYTLSEVSAPSGYTVAPDQTFKMEDKDVIEVTMVDYQASGSGQITVTKKVTYANGGDFIDLIAQDDTFYVNLFTDAAGKYPYKGALPQAIHLVNASAGSVTFSDLAQGTYYVYETDANGNVINLDQQGMHNGSQFMCTVDGGSNIVKLDLKAGPKEGAVNLENVFFDIPTGYSYKGEININKQVLKGTTQTTTDDTFYAGVFTKGDDGVYNLFTVVTLVQNDTVTVEVPLGGKDGTEPINYYILETDADGNILDLDVFEYEVTGEGTVALSKDNLAGNINLVNKIPEDTDGKLRVQKTDGNGVGLAGASFRLTDEDGSVIDEWTSEASAHELELEPGTYTLTEVQAPTGYTGAGSVTIKVDDDYNFSVSGEIDYSYKGGLLKIVNKATTSTPSSGTPVSGGSTPASYSSALSGKVAVKTGDNTPIGAYAAVLVIAALAIAGGIFYKKKRKNDK